MSTAARKKTKKNRKLQLRPALASTTPFSIQILEGAAVVVASAEALEAISGVALVDLVVAVVLGVLMIFTAMQKVALSVTLRAGHPLAKTAVFLETNLGERTPPCVPTPTDFTLTMFRVQRF